MAPKARRKSTPRTKSSGSRWSPEQIAEWRRRDREIMDNSTGYLQDADSVRRFAKDAAAGRVSARILGYSLRNQMLLEKQAADLGFVLTDVASAKQWRERGRRVKAEWHGRNLRLVAPKTQRNTDAEPGTEPERDDETEQTETDDVETGEQDTGDNAPKAKFRTVAVFDIAQTEAIPVEESKKCALCNAGEGEPCRPGCTCGACIDYEPVEDAADIMWNNLIEQIGKAEYGYDWPATAANLGGSHVRVDHDTRTVYAALNATADDPETVADLAAVLGDIIARADRATTTRRAERQAARALTAA